MKFETLFYIILIKTQIDIQRVKTLLALPFHFNLDIGIVVRFNYTGEHRDVQNTIKILKESGCDE